MRPIGLEGGVGLHSAGEVLYLRLLCFRCQKCLNPFFQDWTFGTVRLRLCFEVDDENEELVGLLFLCALAHHFSPARFCHGKTRPWSMGNCKGSILVY